MGVEDLELPVAIDRAVGTGGAIPAVGRGRYAVTRC
jgi:hypothetical protein